MTTPASAPFLVEITRGATVETVHPVVVAVLDADGTTISAAGDIDVAFPVRSTVKPLQALALVSSGAADAHDVSAEELAIACASHNGERRHVELVAGWLARIGLSDQHLRCVSQPARANHNCSGKHAGFLTLAVHLGADPAGYLEESEPVQQMVLARLAERFGIPRSDLAVATDGCGAPVPCVSARVLARGVATLLRGDRVDNRVVAAIEEHPWLIGGTGKFDTRVTAELDGNGFTKVGADGGHVAVLRDPALTIAVKATSGEGRAAQAVMFRLLCRYGVVEPADFPDLAEPEILDSAGTPVGRIVVHGIDE